MAQILRLPPLTPRHHNSNRRQPAASACSTHSWTSLSNSLKCNGRVSCIFSDNRKQEQARKALEGALGEKKMEFEKWDKEIKRREEAGGGGNSGRGGWFGWGGWFDGSDGEHFWQEAQQASLAILGILVLYLIVAKGDLMLAVFLNPLLYDFTRNSVCICLFDIKDYESGTTKWAKSWYLPRESGCPQGKFCKGA